VAVEFRHSRWYNPEIERLLISVGAAFCNVDAPRQPLTDILTSQRAYLRLHGREYWYSSDYSTDDLCQIADLAPRLTARGADCVYIFFNNDIGRVRARQCVIAAEDANRTKELGGVFLEYDRDKVDEIVLALLYLTSSRDQ